MRIQVYITHIDTRSTCKSMIKFDKTISTKCFSYRTTNHRCVYVHARTCYERQKGVKVHSFARLRVSSKRNRVYPWPRVMKTIVWIESSSNSIREIMLVQRERGYSGLLRLMSDVDRSRAPLNLRSHSTREPSRIEQREPLYPRYRNVPAVCNRAHRAISISTVKHLFAKLRPRERNGNNAHGAMDTSVRRIITALNTEALDISVISVFMIVAYALLVSPFPPLPSFPLSAPSFLSFIHSLFVYHVHEHSVVGELSIGRAEMDLPIYVSL